MRIGADSGPWPLHDAAASQAAEALALAAAAPHALMARAGLAVARLARAIAPAARHVRVWCGPGNNGGDGLVAARLLHASGTPVTVVDCAAPGAKRPADAALALQQALAAGVAVIAPSAATATPADLVIDALLGLGTTRAPQGELADAVSAINGQAAPVLAVDLPTGLDANAGQPLGAQAVRAAHTLALLTLKPGLFTAQGRDFAGNVWFDDLAASAGARGAPGAPDATPATATLLGPAFRAALPHAWHKGRRGDLWVVGGAEGMVGAARLAARAALAAGAGRVYLTLLAQAAPEDRIGGLEAAQPELMHRPFAVARTELLGPNTSTASATVVAGCGGGQAIVPHLPTLLAEAARLVLDADALNAVAREPALLRLLQGRAGRGLGTVLTPHPLEAARLLRISSAAVQADRLAHASALAEQAQCVVVLKGSGTVVAAPGRLPAINSSGNASLATAGTGDVLAGWLGGLWAQAPDASPHESACAAVWQHGHAADVARPGLAGSAAPMLAGELIAALSRST